MNALFISLVCAVAVQEPSARDRLRKAIEEAKQELAAEGDRISKEESAQEAELLRARETLSKLTDELVDRTVALSRKGKDLDALRQERAALRKARASAVESWAGLHRTGLDAWRKLADLVDALPPSESRAEQRKLLDQAKTALERPAGEPFDLRPILALSRSLLDEARTAAVFTHPVRNAEGIEEEARVLRAGMILHAYEGLKSGRVGEVAAAPAGQGGYRWTEHLPAKAKLDLRKALGDAGAPGTALYLPLDVTQRLAPERQGNERSFVEVLRAGGPVMIPLLAAGLIALLVTLERIVTLRRKSGGSDAEIGLVLEACRLGRFEEAARRAELGRGLRMRALLASLRSPGLERSKMEEAVRQAVLREMPSLERFLPTIAVLAVIAPMLGLLGTVTGMITTFDVIRLFGSGDPGIMAGGISEALVATATGLVIAIPLLLVHSWLSGRVDRILSDVQAHAAALITIVAERAEQEAARV